MKKKQAHKEGNHERWLLSYADFITLLMIFFIVMYSSSNIDKAKYKAVAESLSIAMGGGGTSVIDLGTGVNGDKAGGSPDEETQNSGGTQTETDKMEDVKKELDSYMVQNGLKGSVTTSVSERGLVVSLKDATFFDSGKADIKTGYDVKIIEIAKIVNQLGNYIRVEGHTDNVPIHNSTFKSNWQLSAIRATNVTELIISKANISPDKVAAVGYGEYRPISENKTEVGRAKNRRVDIVVLSSKYNGEEKVNNK